MSMEDQYTEQELEALDEEQEEEKEEPRRGGSSAVQRAIRFFEDKGLSREDAAAFVFNLTRESGKNLQTNMIHDQGTGYGIAGFRDPVPGLGRRTNLFRFTGTKSPNLEQQLGFMWHELNSSENKALRNVLAAQTPQAKVAAAIGYFRPAAQYAAERRRNASQVLALINGMDAGGDEMPAPETLPIKAQLTALRNPVVSDVEIPEAIQAPDVIPVARNIPPPVSLSDIPMPPVEDPAYQPDPISVGPQQVAQQQPLGQFQFPPETVPPTVNDPGLLYELQQLRYAPEPMPLQEIPTDDPDTTYRLAIPVPASPELSPNEIAAARVAKAVRPQGGRLEGGATALVESGVPAVAALAPVSIPASTAVGMLSASPLSVGATAAMTPGLPAPAKLAALATGAALDTFGGEAAAAPRRGKVQLTPEQIAQRKLEKKTREDAAKVAATRPIAEEYAKSFGNLNRGAENWWLPAAIMVGATGVALAVPKIGKMLTANAVPRLRTVDDAMPGTMSLVYNRDIARQADDLLAGPMNILTRSHAPIAAVKEVEALGIQTKAAGHDLINTAAAFGKVKTATHDYVSAVPLATAMKGDSPAFREFLLMQNYKEDILNRARTMKPKEWATYGPPKAPNGMDANTINQRLRDIAQANPTVIQAVQDYQHLNKALWNFERGGGNFATLSKGQYRDLTKYNRSYVPYDKTVPQLEQNPFQIMLEQMHAKMQYRMHNEMVGRFIGTANQSPLLKQGQHLFSPVTPRDIRINDRLTPQTLTYRVNGKPVKVTTDQFLAKALESDPLLLNGSIFHRAKNIFEQVTTGKFAPWFADTSAIRQWDQAKTTTPIGFKSPTLRGMAVAVPRQSLARMSKHFSEKLHDGWLENILGKHNVDVLGDLLARQWDRSRLAMMQRAGGYEGNAFAYHEHKAMLDSMRGAVPRWYNATVGNLIKDMHNSANFNFVVRNEGRASIEDLLGMARNLTGDPRVHGRIYDRAGNVLTTKGTNEVGLRLAQGYGMAMNFARENIPWANIIQQSLKRTAQSYWQNPGRFIANTYKWSVAPAATSYMTALAIGSDPNGRSYVDYMLYGRSDLDRISNLYVPIPGRPVEQGWRIPRSQERSIAGPMTEVAMDMIVRGLKPSRSAAETTATMLANAPYYGSLTEVTRLAAPYHGFAGSAPMPPVANLVLGSQGMNPAFSMFEQSYLRKHEAFSEHPQLPAFMEAMIRAVGGGIADIAGTAAAAYVASDAGNVAGDLSEALKAAGGRVVQKSAMGRNLTPSQQVQSRHTPINDEFYKRRKEIGDLARFYGSGDEAPKGKGTVSGEVFRQAIMGDKIPLGLVGDSPAAPTNPLYQEFAKRLMDTYRKSAVVDSKMQSTGAIGFPDMLNHYARADAQARAMSRIQPSELSSWSERMESDDVKETREFMKKRNVDITNPKAVQSFWENERQVAMRKLLFVIDKVEDDMSKEAGRPIKLKDLNPYLGGGTTSQY